MPELPTRSADDDLMREAFLLGAKLENAAVCASDILDPTALPEAVKIRTGVEEVVGKAGFGHAVLVLQRGWQDSIPALFVKLFPALYRLTPRRVCFLMLSAEFNSVQLQLPPQPLY